MTRVPIRNNSSERTIKPRVFDAIIDGNRVFLEVKVGKWNERIVLKDALDQIFTAVVDEIGISSPES